MPHLGDATPYERYYGPYLAWHLGLALRGIRVAFLLLLLLLLLVLGTERQLGTSSKQAYGLHQRSVVAAKHNTTFLPRTPVLDI